MYNSWNNENRNNNNNQIIELPSFIQKTSFIGLFIFFQKINKAIVLITTVLNSISDKNPIPLLITGKNRYIPKYELKYQYLL